jgi:hypothetical protein
MIGTPVGRNVMKNVLPPQKTGGSLVGQKQFIAIYKIVS